MSSNYHIALAASGSPAAKKVEEHAFKLCAEQNINSLLVIHVIDTHLAHYGEVDQLGTDVSKGEYVDYIHEEARAISESLQKRLAADAANFGIEIDWVELSGQPLEEISKFVGENTIAKLIVGSGAKPASFFAPKKIMADKLFKKCGCEVVVVQAD